MAVVGAGAIGSAFAWQLARAGHEVTVVARPGSVRLQQLQRDGGIVPKAGERAETRVADRLDAETAYDLVVVTVLDHQVDAVLPDLQRSPARCIQFMFNTFDPERLRDAVGAERCSFGMPFLMAMLDGEGRLSSSFSPSRRTLHADPRWARLFTEAGAPSTVEVDMVLWLRCHVPMCLAMESISAAGQRRGGGASWTEATTVARGALGAFAIVKGLGYRLHPPSKAMLGRTPAVLLAAMLWGVSRIASFRELLATGAAECRALAECVASAGAAVDPPLPEGARAVRAMKPVA